MRLAGFRGTLPDGRPQGVPYGEYYINRVRGKFYNQAQAALSAAEARYALALSAGRDVTLEAADRMIAASLQNAVEMDFPGLDGLQFLVHHGTVIVRGTVPAPSIRPVLVRELGRLPGVRRVIDRCTDDGAHRGL